MCKLSVFPGILLLSLRSECQLYFVFVRSPRKEDLSVAAAAAAVLLRNPCSN